MASQFQQQVDEIRTLLDDESIRVDYYTGTERLDDQTEDGNLLRRVLFEIGDGAIVPPIAKGTVQTVTGKHADPLHGVDFNVTAHVITESYNVTWLLMQNVVNASRQSLNEASRLQSVDFITDPDDSQSYEFGGNRYCRVNFIWRLTLWKGLVPLPAYGCPVVDYVTTGDMGTLTQYTKTGDFT